MSAAPELKACHIEGEHVHVCYIPHALLPALRAVRDQCDAIAGEQLSALGWGEIYTGLNIIDLDDAALLELTGVPGAMSLDQATSAGSAPASSLFGPHAYAPYAPGSRLCVVCDLPKEASLHLPQAAEPAERCGNCGGDQNKHGECDAMLEAHVRAKTFEEAARMAREMAEPDAEAEDDFERGWVRGLILLAEKLEARAKEHG